MRFFSFLRLFVLCISVFFLGASCVRLKATLGDGGVFLSRDGGKTWQQKVFVRQEKKRAVTIGDVAATSLLFDPKNSSMLYLGTEENGVYRTVNGGEQWEQFLPSRGRVHAIGINPKDPKIIFVAMGDRMYRTPNGGGEWSVVYVETRPKVSVTDIAVDGFDPKKVYVSFSNGDLMWSTDGGIAWAVLYRTNSPIVRILIHPKDTRIVTLMTQYGGLIRTKNLGKDWVSLRAALEVFGGGLAGQALLANPSRPDTLLYFSSAGLLVSEDGGKKWEPVQLLSSSNTTPVTVAANTPEQLALLSYATPTTLYVSQNSGKTWATYSLPTTKRPAALLIHPKERTTLYLAVTRQKK